MEAVKRSAAVVAATVAMTKLESLENHALGEIQSWRNHDERLGASGSLCTKTPPLRGTRAGQFRVPFASVVRTMVPQEWKTSAMSNGTSRHQT